MKEPVQWAVWPTFLPFEKPWVSPNLFFLANSEQCMSAHPRVWSFIHGERNWSVNKLLVLSAADMEFGQETNFTGSFPQAPLVIPPEGVKERCDA